ncbi:MAG: MBL fold metallo-hydrolase [Pseudomonadota bacterium]
MIPFIKEFDFAHGRADRLSDRIVRVIANNPGPFTFTGSGTYLVGDEHGIAVIDPGPEDKSHTAAILAAAPGPVTHILITHTHLDHCGGTRDLKEATGAEVLAHSPHPSAPDTAPPGLEEGADFAFRPDTEIDDGYRLTLPAATLTALHTPGHLPNHLCFSLEEEDALFTGDHIMGWSTTVVAPPDGDMDDYLKSLDLLLAQSHTVYYPTHGAPIPAPHSFVRTVKAHRETRDASILAALNASPQSPLDIARIVYTDIDPGLHFAAALNVKAHLDRHVKRGRVSQGEAGTYRLG